MSQWRCGLTVKRNCGDVWHMVGPNGKARCDGRAHLMTGWTCEEMPTDRYVCKRCQRIEVAEKRRV
jgi:hypothetical protein